MSVVFTLKVVTPHIKLKVSGVDPPKIFLV